MKLQAGKPARSGSLMAVLEAAAEMSGWGKRRDSGTALGLAFAEYGLFAPKVGSLVAAVAEISVDRRSGRIRVHNYWAAADAGLVVNPAGFAAQMESAINYGLTAALYGEITFTDGKVDQSNFHDYQILRLSEAPEIDVTIVNSGEPMGGAGEPGTPPIAPAVTGAIYAATGKRIRKLPITKNLA